MKTTASKQIKTQFVYCDKNTNDVYLKENNENWFPINFQWIPSREFKNQLKQKINSVKNIVFLPLVLLICLFSSCSKDTYFGSGEMVSEFRSVDYFTKVSSEGVFEVTITQGASQSIEIIADNNIIDKVKTSVVDNELQLYLDSDKDVYKNISVQANITVTGLTGLKNFGTGNIFAYNNTEDGSFLIENVGIGNIEIDGLASGLNVQNEGSGDISAFAFFIENCSIDIRGSGYVEISCSENLDVILKVVAMYFIRELRV